LLKLIQKTIKTFSGFSKDYSRQRKYFNTRDVNECQDALGGTAAHFIATGGIREEKP
jgi:hypothetical protein